MPPSFYNSHEVVEEKRFYHRGILTYKAARGVGWWFDWTKHGDGPWELRWGGSDAVWKRRKIDRLIGHFRRNSVQRYAMKVGTFIRKHKQKYKTNAATSSSASPPRSGLPGLPPSVTKESAPL